MDTKKRYIKFLSVAKNSVDVVNGSEEDRGYFSFFTPSGVVVGKFTDVESLNYKTSEELTEKISKKIKEGKSVSIFDITAGIYNNFMEQLEQEIESKIVSDNKSIVLEDVTIYMNNSNSSSVNVNNFVIFTDQITGIIPGRIQIQ